MKISLTGLTLLSSRIHELPQTSRKIVWPAACPVENRLSRQDLARSVPGGRFAARTPPRHDDAVAAHGGTTSCIKEMGNDACPPALRGSLATIRLDLPPIGAEAFHTLRQASVAEIARPPSPTRCSSQPAMREWPAWRVCLASPEPETLHDTERTERASTSFRLASASLVFRL